tara:strand:+ start:2553 stop:3215 length:663 start_codon:yes stop_codon:yes gene_type:complete
MGKILLAVFIAFLISLGSLFFVPINFLVSNFLKNSDLNIEYSYLEGNIFSGKILDLYYDNKFIGDFNYENHFSLDNVITNFISIDDQDIQGRVVKQFSDITDIGSLKLKDFSASSIFSNDLINYVDLKLDIKELEIVNFACENIIGNLSISSQEINEELFGELACFEDNTITAELFNRRMKELGNLTYSDAQVKVKISTKIIPDKRVLLLMDYISFTIDL